MKAVKVMPGLGKLLVMIATLFAAVRAYAADCEPSYRRLGPDSAEVGHLTVETSWVLIGCRVELEKMSVAAVARAKAVLAADVAKNPWGLLKFEDDRVRRRELVGRLRSGIPEARIGDVLLLRGKIEE